MILQLHAHKQQPPTMTKPTTTTNPETTKQSPTSSQLPTMTQTASTSFSLVIQILDPSETLLPYIATPCL